LKHLGILKTDTLVNVINWVGGLSVPAYVVAMLIVPIVMGDWAYVQNVWDRWQTLNMGVLAFISSMAAFNIAKYNANKQRERDFVAARALLPDALSELIGYLRASARLLSEAWERVDSGALRPPAPMNSTFPELPGGYKETFSRCISSAEVDVGAFLANIIVRLQIHHSRLKETHRVLSEGGSLVLTKPNLMSYFYGLGKIQALINKLYEFARGEGIFDGSNLEWEDYRNAYRNLNIEIEDIDDLVEFSQRAIKRDAEKEQ
jgi:hypothetical protein